jgi:hypothetical protein
MPTRRGDVRGTSKWKRVRLEVLTRDNWVCFYCGGEATSVDHIHAVAKSDGENDLDPSYLVSACRRCNSSKGSRSQSFFLASISTPPALTGHFPRKEMTETVHIGPMLKENK